MICKKSIRISKNSKKKYKKISEYSKKKYSKELTKYNLFCLQNLYNTCYANVIFCLLWDINDFCNLISRVKIDKLTLTEETIYPYYKISLYDKNCINEVFSIITKDNNKIKLSGVEFNKILITTIKDLFNKFENYNSTPILLNNFFINNISYHEIFNILKGCSKFTYKKREIEGGWMRVFLYKIIIRLRCFTVFDEFFKKYLILDDNPNLYRSPYYYSIRVEVEKRDKIYILEDLINNKLKNIIITDINKYCIIVLEEINNNMIKISNKFQKNNYSFFLKGIICSIFTKNNNKLTDWHTVYVKYNISNNPKPFIVFNDKFSNEHCWLMYEKYIKIRKKNDNIDFSVEKNSYMFLYEKK